MRKMQKAIYRTIPDLMTWSVDRGRMEYELCVIPEVQQVIAESDNNLKTGGENSRASADHLCATNPEE